MAWVIVQLFNLGMIDGAEIHSTPSMVAQSFALHNGMMRQRFTLCCDFWRENELL